MRNPVYTKGNGNGSSPDNSGGYQKPLSYNTYQNMASNSRQGQNPIDMSGYRIDNGMGYYQDIVNDGYSWIDKLFNPQKVQDYQFAQQMIGQDYLNWYSSPEQDMARKEAAGINPNLAAAGIAGSPSQTQSSPSAEVPQSATIGDLAGVAGTAADVAQGVSQIGLNNSTKRLQNANAERIEKLTGVEILDIASSFVQKLTLSDSWSLPVLSMVIGMFGNGYEGVQQMINRMDGCRHMDAVDDEINSRITLYDKEYEEKVKSIQLMETQIGKNNVDLQIAELERQRTEFLRDMDKLRRDRSKEIAFPLDELGNAQMYALYKNSNGDFQKLLTGIYDWAFAQAKGNYKAQTLFGQVNNPYAAAQQLAAQAIEGIKRWIKEDDIEPDKESGVYREGRQYDYDAMHDIFVPLVNSKDGESAVEYALRDLISKYGYSKDDAYRFFDEWNKREGRGRK